MSITLWLWLASLGGAAVFFLAGLLLGRGGKAAPQVTAEASAGERADLRRECEELRAVGERARETALKLQGELGRAAAETEKLRLDQAEGARALEAAREELEEAKRARAAAEAEAAQGTRRSAERERAGAAEVARLTARAAELERAGAAEVARVTAQAAERERAGAAEVARLTARITELERAGGIAGAAAAEIARLRRRVEELERAAAVSREAEAALSRRLADHDPEREATLRHDLAVLRAQRDAEEERARRLEAAHAALLAERENLGSAAARAAALERENQDLRARALVSEIAVAPHPSGAPIEPTESGVHALSALVAEVARLDSVRAAVVGDELGLVVSCQGTHADELAAIGALLNRACSDARKVLPMAHIQRVVLEDESNLSITMRPLGHAAGGAPDDQLTLVTLACGAEPDPGAMARILPPRHAST